MRVLCVLFSASGCLCPVEVNSVVSVSEAKDAFIIKFEMDSVGEILCVYRFISSKRTEGRLVNEIGTKFRPAATVEKKICQTALLGPGIAPKTSERGTCISDRLQTPVAMVSLHCMALIRFPLHCYIGPIWTPAPPPSSLCLLDQT